jgi:hypothetical protein
MNLFSLAVLVFNGHFYLNLYNSIPFNSALDIAPRYSINGMQGHMVTLAHFAERTFVVGCLRRTWVGVTFNTTQNAWMVATGPELGTKAYYLPWNAGQPNGGSAETCAEFSGAGLNDISCSQNQSLVIEFECTVTSTDVSSCPCTYRFCVFALFNS